MRELPLTDELDDALSALRQAGASRCAPLEMHFIETLQQRLPSLPADVQQLVRQRLTRSITALSARCEQAATDHAPEHATASAQPSERPASLRDVVTHWKAQPARPAPLLALRQALSQASVQKQVAQALREAPRHAGPINSHMLMLRSLDWLQAHAPAYLQRFMAYADTLLSLEQAGKKKPSSSKPKKTSK